MNARELCTPTDNYISDIKDIEFTTVYLNLTVKNIDKLIMCKLKEPYTLHPSTHIVPNHLLLNFVDMRKWIKKFCDHYGYNIHLTSDFIMMIKHIKTNEKIYKHLDTNNVHVHKKEFLMAINRLIN